MACMPRGAHTAPDGDPEAVTDMEAMVELAWRSGCFNCHDLDTTLRGPPWRAVAERYRGQPEVFDALLKKIIEGGGGAWGDEVMSPNRRVPEEDVRSLLAWLLALE